MKVLSDKGKEWSKVSVEIENNFNAWLTNSEVKKEEILKRVDKDSFKLVYSNEKDCVRICLSDDIGTIGLPFIWIKNGEILFVHFKTDAALLLLYISSLCGNEKSKKEIGNFIKIHKLNK